MKTHSQSFPSRVFVTGTDTGIGKTLVSAILVNKLQAAYWKPIQSGLDEETDTRRVRRYTGLPESHFLPERYRLRQPLSPHLSSRLDGIDIKLESISIPGYKQNHLVIEGAGGVMVPLNKQHYIADLIRYLQVPVILVARSGLGTINHTLLTIEKLNSMGIQIFGVVMNGEKNYENKRAIEELGHTRVIAEVGRLPDLSPENLEKLFKQVLFKI